MHIGLNAHLLSFSRSYRAAGINSYIYNLLRCLPGVGKQHRYTVFLGDAEASGALPDLTTKMTSLPTVNPAVRIIWEQLVQPPQLWRERIDLLHSLAFVQPVVLPCAGVITIYDLSFFLFPEGFQPWRRLYLKWGTGYSARRARRIIAISNSTKQDIVRLLRVPGGKVEVVPCGVEEDFRPVEDPDLLEDFRSKRGLARRMILFVGTIEPRKNLVTLLRSYALLRQQIQPPPLVIGGPKGWRHEEVFAQVQELDLQEHVIFPGYIPREELPLWYNAADLFAYPSLYEGFGLPPLEAMACGTPVVSSNSSSLPEVVGDAGVLVNPHGVEEMSEAMQRLLSDNTLRAEMATRGLAQARTFSWQRAAAETLQVYDRAMTDHRG
jgi:glycosyltransferase involved in cell wall biosynthesis